MPIYEWKLTSNLREQPLLANFLGLFATYRLHLQCISSTILVFSLQRLGQLRTAFREKLNFEQVSFPQIVPLNSLNRHFLQTLLKCFERNLHSVSDLSELLFCASANFGSSVDLAFGSQAKVCPSMSEKSWKKWTLKFFICWCFRARVGYSIC